MCTNAYSCCSTAVSVTIIPGHTHQYLMHPACWGSTGSKVEQSEVFHVGEQFLSCSQYSTLKRIISLSDKNNIQSRKLNQWLSKLKGFRVLKWVYLIFYIFTIWNDSFDGSWTFDVPCDTGQARTPSWSWPVPTCCWASRSCRELVQPSVVQKFWCASWRSARRRPCGRYAWRRKTKVCGCRVLDATVRCWEKRDKITNRGLPRLLVSP